MYADFNFYKNTYHGDTISETDYPKWGDRASEKLDEFAFGKIDTAFLTDNGTKVKKAACAIADVMAQIDAATKSGGRIQSRSSGGESVTYANNDTIITAVLSDKRAQNQLMFDAARDYLGQTGILFQGV